MRLNLMEVHQSTHSSVQHLKSRSCYYIHKEGSSHSHSRSLLPVPELMLDCDLNSAHGVGTIIILPPLHPNNESPECNIASRCTFIIEESGLGTLEQRNYFTRIFISNSKEGGEEIVHIGRA